VRVGLEYVHAGIGWTSLAAALLAGAVITLMTWMELSSEDAVSRLFAALAAAFLLAIGPLSHAVVVSLELFAALHAGAPFGYFEWLKVLGWATLGNVIGGLALVTMLRLVQVGRDKIVQEQRRSRIDWRWRDRQGQSSRSAPVDEGWRTDARGT